MKIKFRDDATQSKPPTDAHADNPDAQAEEVARDRATQDANADLRYDAADDDGDEKAAGHGNDASDLLDLQRERDDLEAQLLRTKADYQNYIRRSQQNAQRESEQQTISMVKGLTMVLDHFDRALSIDPSTTDTKTLFDGVAGIQDELLRALSRYGVARIEASPGDPFDPERHEALLRIPHDTIEQGHIVKQLEPGYAVHQTPVRPAKVSIAG